jgi:hypothetical protein
VQLIDMESEPRQLFHNQVGAPQDKPIAGVFPGEYSVDLQCPTGYVVSASWGDTDLFSTPGVQVHEGVQHPIEIQMKYGGGTLSVFVTDAAVRPQEFIHGQVRGAGVLLIPQGGSAPGPIAQFVTPADDAAAESAPLASDHKKLGAYFGNLAPGDYMAYAFSDLSSIEYRDPQVLRTLTAGLAIHINEDSKEVEIAKVTR